MNNKKIKVKKKEPMDSFHSRKEADRGKNR
jgi:hypothetical protein